MSDWAQLVTQLESAAEGSEQLDVAICRAINGYGDNEPLWHTLQFTRLLDHALVLIPKGWFWRVGRTSLYCAWAGVHETHPDHGQPGDNEFFWSRQYWQPRSTPTLALCIVAIKARQAIASGRARARPENA